MPDKKNLTPGERYFNLNNLFYSRTDERGVIAAGNWVFQRVSGYSWEELIGAPHKIIRHPDMPKGVFWLLWTTLKDGKNIAAYVKNRAKNGHHYWVLANVSPVDSGYFSVRVKPTSDLRKQVESLYAKMLEHEKQPDVTPEDSAAWLLRQIADLGFRNYAEFEAHAMRTETIQRNRMLSRPDKGGLLKFQEIIEEVSIVEEAVVDLRSLFDGISLMPSNLRLTASRLEPAGGPISTIAVSYASMAEAIQLFVERVFSSGDSGVEEMRRVISEASLLSGAAMLQIEVGQEIRNERRGADHNDNCGETEILDKLSQEYEERVTESMSDVAQQVNRMLQSTADLKRFVTGLSSTRTLCLVENARLQVRNTSLEGIVQGLGEFQQSVDALLKTINAAMSRIKRESDGLLKLDEFAVRDKKTRLLKSA